MKALAATSRTIDAIRRADGLARMEPGGKMRKGPYPGGFGASSYSGPFAVVKKDATHVTIILLKDEANGYYSDSVVQSGSTKTFIANEDVTISADGIVYADITYSTAWACSFANAANLPGQSDTHLYVAIARVIFSGGAITDVKQLLEDNIYPNKYGRGGD